MLLSGTSGWLKASLTAFFLCFFSVQIFLTTHAAAQVKGKPPAKAVKLYDKGRKKYEAGRYREAVVDLKAALELDPKSPTLAYNVARVSELLGELSQAVFYYRRYLSLLPQSETKERARIGKTLRRLKGAIKRAAALSESEGPGGRESSPALGTADPLFWSVAVSGAALLGVGIVTGVMALDRFDEMSEFVVGQDGDLDQRNEIVSDTKLLAIFSDIGLIGGSALLVSAGFLFFLRNPKSSPNRNHLAIDVDLNPRHASLRLSGTL